MHREGQEDEDIIKSTPCIWQPWSACRPVGRSGIIFKRAREDLRGARRIRGWRSRSCQGRWWNGPYSEREERSGCNKNYFSSLL